MPISSSYRLSDDFNPKPWNTTKRRHFPKTSKIKNIKTVSRNHGDVINLTCGDKGGSVQLKEITLKKEKLSRSIKGASNVFVNSKCTLERTRQQKQKQRDKVITNNFQSPDIDAPIIKATEQGYRSKTVRELCLYPGNGRITTLKRKREQRKKELNDNTKIARRNPRKAAKNANTASLIPGMVEKAKEDIHSVSEENTPRGLVTRQTLNLT